MNLTPRPILIGLIALAALLAFAPPAIAGAEDTASAVTRVTLRSTVRLNPSAAPLTLADLARIEGPQRDALSALPIDPGANIAPKRWSTISLDTVREQLAQAPGVNHGALVVSGADIQITRVGAREGDHAEGTGPAAKARPTGPVLRDHIERWVYARLRTKPSATRLRFNERDADLLSTPTTGRIVEIAEHGRSEQMSLRIAIYENERIIEDTTIRFEALIQRQVRVSTTQIRRRTGISEAQTTLETRWLPPTEPIADPQGCLGQVTRNTIDPGSVLLTSMLEPPVVIKRGEMVSARSLAGSVSVAMTVRAMKDGRMGELIELESRDRKQKFTARVAGPGRVIIVNNAQSSATPPATP